MGKKILDSKILYMVLSILISVSLWVWVTSRDGNREGQTYSNLPVEFVGEDILADRGLMIVNRNVTGSIRVQATPMIHATLGSNKPILSANVSGIMAEGKHTVSFNINLPQNSGVTQNDVEYITGGSGNTITLEVARALSRSVDIRGEFKGSVAEGYLAGDAEDFRFLPEKLTISGQAELVNQVAYARVTIDEENLTEDVEGEFPFKLIGASGDPLEGLNVTADADTIYTRFPIRATAEIPLEVKLVEGGGLSTNDVRLDLSDKSIVVAGSKEAVAALANEGSMVLGTIDLAKLDDATVKEGGEVTFPIALPDELENLSGITEVTARLTVRKRVETRDFEVTSRISAINVPEGWQANIITQALKVQVRGTAALLDELTEENIQVVADLQDINQVAGQYTRPVSVRLYSTGSVSDVGVVDLGSYTIVVSLTRAG